MYAVVLCLMCAAVRDDGVFSTEEIVQIVLLVVVTALLVTVLLALAICYLRYLTSWFSRFTTFITAC